MREIHLKSPATSANLGPGYDIFAMTLADPYDELKIILDDTGEVKIEVENDNILAREEIFGPVVTIYVYDDADFAKTLHLCDTTSPYALTGAVFGRDRKAIELAERALR